MPSVRSRVGDRPPSRRVPDRSRPALARRSPGAQDLGVGVGSGGIVNLFPIGACVYESPVSILRIAGLPLALSWVLRRQLCPRHVIPRLESAQPFRSVIRRRHAVPLQPEMPCNRFKCR
jgi:hypothetical protein